MTRLISGLLAAVWSLLLMLMPFVLGKDVGGARHGWLMLLLIGVSGAWGHALGYEARNRWIRTWMQPYVTWPLIIAASVALWWSRGA